MCVFVCVHLAHNVWSRPEGTDSDIVGHLRIPLFLSLTCAGGVCVCVCVCGRSFVCVPVFRVCGVCVACVCRVILFSFVLSSVFFVCCFCFLFFSGLHF